MRTTCIGAYPKPDFVRLPDWFSIPAGPDTSEPTKHWEAAMAAMGDDAPAVIERGVAQAIADQLEAGIDIPTDGEISRENYIHYHCRHLHGIDFSTLTEKALRGGAYQAELPTVTGKISARDSFLAEDWRRAQRHSSQPVKITMPGPMTICDTTSNAYYDDPVRQGQDIAKALNVEVLALAEAGCGHIQIDEPLFARRPDEALDYGFDNLERAFHRCPAKVVKTVHMCCGYPDALDVEHYPKAGQQAYHQLATAIEDSCIDAISLEDAHRYNNLKLLEAFATTTVVLGVVAIAKSRVEGIDEIRTRLLQAAEHIDRERLIAAPDCGLGILGRDLARAKLKNMVLAANSL